MKKSHLLFIVHIFLLVNLRFEAWPEMLVYPYLLQKDFLLYRDIINPYLPLFTGFLHLFFSVVGLSLTNLKLLTWAIIALSDGLIFWIVRKRYGKKAALFALSFFIIFQPLLDGNGLWFDLALAPILLLAFHWQSPFLLATSFFIKQSVLWLLPTLIKKWKKLILALIVLFLISTAIFSIQGTLSDYLFWAWQFPFTLFHQMPGYKDFGTSRVWSLALFPFALPAVLYVLGKPKLRLLLKSDQPLLWALLSFLFIFPRFGLFHLQPALAFAALSLGQSIQKISLKKYFKKSTFKLFAIGYVLLASLIWHRHIRLFWHKPPRFFEPEIYAAAQNLAELTQPNEPLLFLNAPDQLFFLSQRLPPKPWAITFPWYMEIPGIQERLIQAVKDQAVQSVVFSHYQNQGGYVPGSYRPDKLDQFIRTEFVNVTMLGNNIQLKSQ